MVRFLICLCFLLSAVCNAATVTRETILQLGLPVVFVETDTGEAPASENLYNDEGQWIGIKYGEKLTGRIYMQLGDSVLYESGAYVADSSGMTIHVRGNSTAMRDKKPYKVKLQTKADLLRRGDKRFRSKHWVLLKRGYSADDMIGFEVNRIVGMPYQPAYEYVNLFLNGEYRGLYTIAENVRRDPSCRIDVDKEEGFIVELDVFYSLADLYFMTDKSPLGFTFKYPDESAVDNAVTERVRNAMVAMENAIAAGDYENHIDVDSWVRYVMGIDILAMSDVYGCNQFYAKYDCTDSSSVFIPCIWDFDSVRKYDGQWGCKHGTYMFDRLLASENRAFCDAYRKLWHERSDAFFAAIDSLLTSLLASDVCRAIDASMAYDPEWYAGRGTMTQQLTVLKEWFPARKKWIDSHLDEIAGSVQAIESVATDGRDSAVYDLFGRRIRKHAGKGLYIRNGRKVII